MPGLSPSQWLAVIGWWEVAIGAAFLFRKTIRLATVRARDRGRFHWLPTVWAGLIFLQLIQLWWVYFYVLQAEVGRGYFAYVFFLLVPVLLFLIACWVLPDRESDDGSPID